VSLLNWENGVAKPIQPPNQEDTLQVPSSHTPRNLHVAFDEQRLVAEAGLLLPAVLARQLGLPELLEQRVDLGQAPGRAHVAAKAMTLIASLVAGGDCIDDADALRAANCEPVLGHRVPAPSTLGTFLRSFTPGHSKQLDAVSGELLGRAWRAGAGPGDGPLTIDIDSTICETYGHHKQGAKRVNYAQVRGYHPLLATTAQGELLHARLRSGTATSGRGAAHFLAETLKRVRRAGAAGRMVVRADSGFYAEEVVRTCRRHGARFSITARMFPKLLGRITEIPEGDWRPIPWMDGRAEVAEIPYLAFANTHHGKRRGRAIPVRLIVRRTPARRGTQLPLQGILVDHHALITDREGDAVELEADHRRHAGVENTIRELKYGVGLNHLPSGQFGANAAWLALNLIAHNLIRWIARLGLQDGSLSVKTLRRRLFSVPGRLVSSARRWRLRLPHRWPWAQQFLTALQRLRALTWTPLQI
jgi:hypothetical protein